MMATNRIIWPLLGAVAFVQSAVVAKIVWDRARLINSGREITMQVVPVDPRDIFRGDYVVLGYGVSPLEAELFDPADRDGLRVGETAFVTLRPAGEGTWNAVAAAKRYPAKPASGEIVLKGRVTAIRRGSELEGTTVAMRFGIESYFVPEGTGRDIETKVRSSAIQAIVAVGDDGEAALKGLVIDGTRRLDPPLL